MHKSSQSTPRRRRRRSRGRRRRRRSAAGRCRCAGCRRRCRRIVFGNRFHIGPEVQGARTHCLAERQTLAHQLEPGHELGPPRAVVDLEHHMDGRQRAHDVDVGNRHMLGAGHVPALVEEALQHRERGLGALHEVPQIGGAFGAHLVEHVLAEAIQHGGVEEHAIEREVALALGVRVQRGVLAKMLHDVQHDGAGTHDGDFAVAQSGHGVLRTDLLVVGYFERFIWYLQVFFCAFPNGFGAFAIFFSPYYFLDFANMFRAFKKQQHINPMGY